MLRCIFPVVGAKQKYNQPDPKSHTKHNGVKTSVMTKPNRVRRKAHLPQKALGDSIGPVVCVTYEKGHTEGNWPQIV